MNVFAVVVEHVEYDGYLRSLQIQSEPGRTMTIAFADEFDEPHTGPFHFLSARSRDTFEKDFAECLTLKLSDSNFSVTDGEYRFHTLWKGIPTERGCLSCYSLSLPEFAVPSHIRFENPDSGQEYSKSVIRDDQRHRFVTYLECRSEHGSFDFSLEVKFKSEEENFGGFEYSDQNLVPVSGAIDACDDVVPPHLQQSVRHFFSPKGVGGVPPSVVTTAQWGLFASDPIASADRQISFDRQSSSQSSNESKGIKREFPEKLPPRLNDLSQWFDPARLTEAQHEAASLAWEHQMSVSKIAKHLGRNRTSIQERLAAATKKISEARSAGKQARRRASKPDQSD